MNIVVNLIIGLALAVISAFLRPKPPEPNPGERPDVPRTEEGTEIVRAWGEVWIQAPHSVWYGDFDTKEIKS